MCEPSDNVSVLHVAVASGCTVALSHSVLSSSTTNETVPVGVPDPGEFTISVDVKVTGDPGRDRLRDARNKIVVDAGIVVCSKMGDVLPEYIVSPEYATDTGTVPADSAEVVNAAVPLLSRVAAALRDPAVNTTFPVGMPELPATVAVKVIVWPYVEGLAEEFTEVDAGLPSIAGFTTCVSVPALAAKPLSPL